MHNPNFQKTDRGEELQRDLHRRATAEQPDETAGMVLALLQMSARASVAQANGTLGTREVFVSAYGDDEK